MAGLIVQGVPAVNFPGFRDEVGLLEVEEEDRFLLDFLEVVLSGLVDGIDDFV